MTANPRQQTLRAGQSSATSGHPAGQAEALDDTVMARVTPICAYAGDSVDGASVDANADADACANAEADVGVGAGTTGAASAAEPSKPEKSMPPAFIAALALCAVAMVWLVARDPTAPAGANAPATPPLELAAVDVAVAQPRVLSEVLPLSGTISPYTQATVRSKVTGDVEQVTVREGQDIEQGDIIARVDRRNLQAQYDRELASVEKARAELDLATLNRDKNRSLLEQRYISQNTYESTESAYGGSVANFKLAQAQARLAKLSLDDTVIRAPFSGTVAMRLVQPGEKVSPDSSIVTLVDLRQMVLEAALPASEIPAVAVGQRVRFTVGGFGEREFIGEVQRINPVTTSGSRAVAIYVAVDNADRALKGGMFAQGELTLRSTQPVLSIPQRAVRQQAGISYVHTLQDHKVVRTPVTLGPQQQDEAFIEVRAGLTAGERVILTDIADSRVGSSAIVHGADSVAASAAEVAASR